VAVGVGVKVLVGVAVGVGVEVRVGVGVAVGVAVFVGVGVTVGVLVLVGVAVGVGVGGGTYRITSLGRCSSEPSKFTSSAESNQMVCVSVIDWCKACNETP
jgi:hypothetical protein